MIDVYKSIQEVDKILKEESNFFVKTEEQFNRCIDHIFQLITDAYTLYINNAFSSSLFLSIAIIEEVAKVHMGMYLKPSNENIKKDKLRNHKTKEIIGTNYTICMEERIKRAIEEDRLEKIFEMAYSGELKNMREKSIYCECKDGEVVIPNDVINKEFSKNMLLFAIESFDDNLVGYTDYSIRVSEKSDIVFENVATSIEKELNRED